VRGARVRSYARSFAWSGVDQALSSLSNVVIAVAIARAGGTAGLGRFSVAFACYLLVLSFNRQLVAEPLLSLRWHPIAANTLHEAPALGASVLYLSVASLAVLGIGVATGRIELVVLAPLLPGVCIQDLERYIAFRRQQHRLPATLDGLWVVFSALFCYWVLRSGSPVVAVAAWGLAGGISAIYGAIRLRLVPTRPSVSIRWWRREAKHLGGFLTLASVAYMAGAQGVLLGIAATIGVEALGQLREAQILLGPAALGATAFSFFALPRLIRREGEITSGNTGLMSVAAATIAVTACGGSILLAPLVARLIFGHSTAVALALLVPLSLQLVFEAAAAGFSLPLQATQRGAGIAVARAASVALGVPGVIWAASVGGIVLAGWALAGQAGIYVLVLVIGWRTGLGSPTARSQPAVEHGPAQAESRDPL
jgi:O-antigen/teichoic acid export membrane protein